MILAQSDQFEICKEAFDYQIQCIDRDNARLVTDDGLVMTSLDSLLLYSTLLANRSALWADLGKHWLVIRDINQALQ